MKCRIRGIKERRNVESNLQGQTGREGRKAAKKKK